MFPLVFGSVFVLAGLLPIALAWTAFAKDRAIARWPRAPGKITSSRVETRTGTRRDQKGHSYSYTSHQLFVEYTYVVDGVERKGDQVSRVSYTSSTMPDVDRYAPGTDVQVYYDPADPKTAYLETHFSIGAVILGGMG